MDYSHLVAAIENLSASSGLDYFVALSPILISLVALVFSFISAGSQNKIALFEKRYAVYCDLNFFYRLAEDTASSGDEDDSWSPNRLLAYISLRWDMQELLSGDALQGKREFFSCFQQKRDSINQALFLFDAPRRRLQIDPADIDGFLTPFRDMVYSAIKLSRSADSADPEASAEYLRHYDRFQENWIIFQNKHWSSMLKLIQL